MRNERHFKVKMVLSFLRKNIYSKPNLYYFPNYEESWEKYY